MTPPRTLPWPRVGLLAVWLSAVPVAALAQPSENMGVRALGMGGAFVAVADDMSATYWNPAGLAIGNLFAGLVEVGGAPDLSREGAATSGRRVAVAVGMPALGLSYLRRPVTVDPGGRVVDLSHVGATLLQSLSDHVVVGSTVRWVAVEGSSQVDADAGVLVTFARVRAGVTVWNLRAPTFDAGDEGLRVPRHVRAGLAVTPTDAWTISADADLTRVEDAAGPLRRFAFGAERWVAARRVAIRAGGRTSVQGPARMAGSLGGSVAVRAGLWLEGQFTRGADRADHSWGIGLRIGY